MVFYAEPTSTVISEAKREGQTDREIVTNLVFYADQTSTVISEEKRERQTDRDRESN